jgi:hypothetical protein
MSLLREGENMSQSDDQPSANYVTCPCQHCSGKIEFDASDFGASETRTAECPHCHMETIIFVPPTAPTPKTPKPASPPLPSSAVSPITQPFLMTIGDIGITSDRVVTPNGTGPLAGSQWICTDMSRTESKMPAVAIILAIVFALLCLIGLLFLLMKERVTTGYVEVSVRTGDIYHKVQIPIHNADRVAQIREQVNKAQVMAQATR